MNINIHQIYFDPSQLPLLDPDFQPFNHCKNPHPELREYFIFRSEYFAHKISKDPNTVTGYVSWKFKEKTGVNGKKFINFVQKNPGYDVYFVNPFPHQLRFKNVWLQGEKYHPGILDLAQELFLAVGMDMPLENLIMNETNTAYCNFWVGTPTFWDQYISFCEKIYQHIFTKLPQEKLDILFQRADPIIDASYFPFIFERLFSTLLCMNPKIKAIHYPLPKTRIGIRIKNFMQRVKNIKKFL